MAKKEYVSPAVAVYALLTEDVITASPVSTFVDDDGKRYTYGGFKSGWLS